MEPKPTLTIALFYLMPFVNANGPCGDDIFLEAGKRQMVSCTFDMFQAIGWINGNSKENLPVISLQNSVKQGPGYESGEYNITENGSLIINNVTLRNDFNYTVLHVSPRGLSTYFLISVNVFVSPVPEYPVINGLTNYPHVVLDVSDEGLVNCSMNRIRPNVTLEWIHISDVIILRSTQHTEDNSDGTYNTSLVSTFLFTNDAVDRVTLQCKVAGPKAFLFPSVTTVDLLLTKNFPIVNGLENQRQVVVDLRSESENELTCSMNKVPDDVSLAWVILTPFLPDETFVQDKPSLLDNGDRTVNITLRSTFMALSHNILRATLLCVPSSKTKRRSLRSTKVIILFPTPPPVPVIDGCHSHQSDCSVLMLEGEKVACSALNVPSFFESPRLTIDADAGSLSVIKSTLNKHSTGDYDIITSYHYSIGEQTVAQIRCLLTGNKNTSQFELTATAQIIVQENQFSGGSKVGAILSSLIICLQIGLYVMLSRGYLQQRLKRHMQQRTSGLSL